MRELTQEQLKELQEMGGLSDLESLSEDSTFSEAEEGEVLSDIPEEADDVAQNSKSSLPPTPAKSEPPASRWDQTAGKQLPNPACKYRHWRRHKFNILDALQQGGGQVSFVRRVMLFRHGANIPKNVLHYYKSRYYSPSCFFHSSA